MSALTSHDLGRRSSETELMDTEPVDIDEYRRCLQDLANVNTLTLTRRPILRWLERALARVGPGERVSLIDVGYGYGDILRAIRVWSRRRGFVFDLVGLANRLPVPRRPRTWRSISALATCSPLNWGVGLIS
jgi:hypothetical protein